MHCEEIFYLNPNMVYRDGNLQNRSSCCSSSSRSSCSSSSCLPMLPSSDCEGKRFPCQDFTEDNNAIQAIREEKMNSELTSKLPLPSSKCSMNSLSCSRHRMRQNLTEAEKEVWRMRRVLANRESARQTIIRRQARREDLSKRITELSLNNRNMKMEREHVMKEYMRLKRKNNQLKDELAMAIEYKVKCRETCSAFIPAVCSPWPVISAPLEIDFFADRSKATVWEGKSTLHELPLLEDATVKLDISLDASNHCSSIEDEERAEDVQVSRAATAARKRRKEILKLKHISGRHITLHI